MREYARRYVEPVEEIFALSLDTHPESGWIYLPRQLCVDGDRSFGRGGNVRAVYAQKPFFTAVRCVARWLDPKLRVQRRVDRVLFIGSDHVWVVFGGALRKRGARVRRAREERAEVETEFDHGRVLLFRFRRDRVNF